MAKLDEYKEKIGLYKFWLGVVVALFTGISAWLINNYTTANNWLIFAAIIVLLGLIVAVLIINKKIKKALIEIRTL